MKKIDIENINSETELSNLLLELNDLTKKVSKKLIKINKNKKTIKKDIIKTDNKNLKNVFSIDVINVKTEDDIENTELYYIENENKFAIKINNKILKGNVGKIFSKFDKKEKTICCVKDICNIENCYYYHEDIDTRNYEEFSWKHNNKINIKTLQKNKLDNIRTIGSKENIENDLLLLSINEIKLRNSQLIHDILIYQIINNYYFNKN